MIQDTRCGIWILDAGYKKQSGKWMIEDIRFIQISTCDPQSVNAHLVTEARAMAREKLKSVPIKMYSARFCFLASSKRRMDFAATRKPIPSG